MNRYRLQISRNVVAFAVLCPIVVTGYLLGIGFESRRLLDMFTGGDLSGSAILYLVSLAFVGAGVAIAVHRGVRVAVAGALVYLLLAPWEPLFGPGPQFGTVVEFGADAMFLAVTVWLLASVEYGLRNRPRVHSILTPRVVQTALLVGVVHAIGLVAVRWVFEFSWGGSLSPIVLGMILWMILGTILLGAVPVVLFHQLTLVTPALLVGGTTSFTVYSTWMTVQSVQASGVAMGPALTPLTLYMIGWFVPLTLALLVGGLEYVLRTQLSRDPPTPDITSQR